MTSAPARVYLVESYQGWKQVSNVVWRTFRCGSEATYEWEDTPVSSHGRAVRRWTVMSGTGQKAAETAVTDRYEALFRVSQTLISIRSSEELFSVLARELRAVVNFYVMGVGIYDEKAHEMHTKSYGEPGLPLQAPKFAPEETFSWWVYQHQQPLIIPPLAAETRFPPVPDIPKNPAIRSAVPL